MKPGQESKTAVLVCMGRAIAHETTSIPRFSDPTALALLPEKARATVEALRSAAPARGPRARLRRAHLRHLAGVMAARTVEIDDAIRARSGSQVVILGAGLDGRAWRMPELRGVEVFEVDHPDSQRGKRARVETLAPMGNVHFVPVDFERDSLDAALAQAGHDSSKPTTWVWEGVVMYLTPADVESSLAVIARRSAPGSRLIVAYHAPSRALSFASLVSLVVRRWGEPLKSAYTVEAMRALLAKHGFATRRDQSLATIAKELSPKVGQAVRGVKRLRIVTADRA